MCAARPGSGWAGEQVLQLCQLCLIAEARRNVLTFPDPSPRSVSYNGKFSGKTKRFIFQNFEPKMLFQRCSPASLLNDAAEIAKLCSMLSSQLLREPWKWSWRELTSVSHASAWEPVVKPKFVLPDKTDFSPSLPWLFSDYSSKIPWKYLVFPHTV